MRMREPFASSLWLAFVLASGSVSAEPVKLQGEVVDLSCYLGRGASGPDHAACAERCIASSRVAGFRDGDGTVYLLLQAPDAPPPAELVSGLAGMPVEIEGTATERDGFRAFRITRARMLEP